MEYFDEKLWDQEYRNIDDFNNIDYMLLTNCILESDKIDDNDFYNNIEYQDYIVNKNINETKKILFDYSRSDNKHIPKFSNQNKNKISIFKPRFNRPMRKCNDFQTYIACSDQIADINQFCVVSGMFINPKEYGLIPSDYWKNESISLLDIVEDFFRRKNHPKCRFTHKLYNALQIVQHSPFLQKYFGIEWASSSILIIHKSTFAHLLGIFAIDGSLFHRQGNFTTYGFVDAPASLVKEILGIDKFDRYDFESTKFLIHKDGSFTSHTTEEELKKCKWDNWRKLTK